MNFDEFRGKKKCGLVILTSARVLSSTHGSQTGHLYIIYPDSPFFPPSIPGVPKTFGKGVVVNF